MMSLWSVWPVSPAFYLPAAALFAGLVADLLYRVGLRAVSHLEPSFSVETAVGQGSRWRMRLLAALVGTACAWRFGPTIATLAACGFCCALVTLAWLDAHSGFLPDALTQPLLWSGLLVNSVNAFTVLFDAVMGAVSGYLTLWVIAAVFLLTTGRRGMGHGDFKLLAALGAWLGWQALPTALLLSSAVGLLVAITQRLRGNLSAGQAISFGPYLALAGVIVLLW